MLDLVRADLLRTVRLWVGVFAVLFISGVAAGLPAALVETAVHSDTNTMLALLAIASVVMVLTAVSLTIVVSAVVRTLVELRRRAFALWLITGMSPGQVAAVLLGQVATVSVVSALLGAGSAMLAMPPLVKGLLAGSSGLESAPVTLGPGAAAAGAGVAVLVAALASIPLARDVGRTPLLRLLRGEQSRRPRVTRRIVVAALLLALVAAMAAGLPGALPNGASQSVLIGPVVIAGAAVTAPFFLPRLVRVWTAVVPVRVSASWHLARASVSSAARRSSAAIVSFMVAIGVPWTFLVGQQTVETTSPGAAALDPRALGLLLGGPTVLAAVGAGAAIYMAGRTRARDDRLLSVLGASPLTRVLVPVWEAVIYVATAALTCAVLGGGVALSESLILSTVARTVHAATAPSVLIALGVGCLILALAATFASRITQRQYDRAP